MPQNVTEKSVAYDNICASWSPLELHLCFHSTGLQEKVIQWSMDLTHTHTHTQPFYSCLDFVWDNPCELVPEETFTHSHSSWSSIIPICFLHVLRVCFDLASLTAGILCMLVIVQFVDLTVNRI